MRTIAHIMPWSAIGGTEHATLRIARSVEGADYHSLFYCPSSAPTVNQFYKVAGCEVHSFAIVEPRWKWPWRFFLAAWRLAGSFRRYGVDIVHCSDVTAVAYAGLAARFAGCHLLCHVRNRNDDIPRREWRLLRFVDTFIFVSKASSRCFGYPAEASQRVVLYDGIEPRSITPYSQQEVKRIFSLPLDARLIGTSARVNPQKDFPTLIAACAAVFSAFPNIYFIVVGDHQQVETNRRHYEYELVPLLRKWGVEDRFLFAGFREDAQQLIAALELFVLSTHFEGLPLAVLEAMAQARPVVATAVDGLPEIIVDGETGFLVEHQNVEQLGASICNMLADPVRAASMGMAGRHRVQNEFSQEIFARNVRRIYDTATP